MSVLCDRARVCTPKHEEMHGLMFKASFCCYFAMISMAVHGTCLKASKGRMLRHRKNFCVHAPLPILQSWSVSPERCLHPTLKLPVRGGWPQAVQAEQLHPEAALDPSHFQLLQSTVTLAVPAWPNPVSARLDTCRASFDAQLILVQEGCHQMELSYARTDLHVDMVPGDAGMRGTVARACMGSVVSAVAGAV